MTGFKLAKPGPGRPRGSKDSYKRQVGPHISEKIRAMVVEAMSRAGGGGDEGAVRYLEAAARTDPKTFLALLARCIQQTPPPEAPPDENPTDVQQVLMPQQMRVIHERLGRILSGDGAVDVTAKVKPDPPAD